MDRVTIVATDAAGNEATHDVTITVDTTAPDLAETINTAVVNGSTTTDTDSDVSTTTVLKIQKWTVVRDSNGVLRLSGSAPLDGVYAVTIVATDAAGNSASHDVTITVDTTAPDLTETINTAVFNGSSTTETVLLTVDSRGETGLDYRLEDTEVDSGASAPFVIDSNGVLRLSGSAPSDGVYAVTIVATDAAGNEATHDVTITVDTTAPDLAETINTAVVNGSTTTDTDLLTIDSDGETGLDYRLEDTEVDSGASAPFVIDSNGVLRLSGSAPSDADYAVTIVATDAAGNEATHDVTITVDTTAPSFEGVSASFLVGSGEADTEVGSTIAADTNAISYSLVGDDAGLFMIDGEGLISIDTDTSLTDGTYSVTVEAEDAAGNEATHDVTITVETPEAIALQYLNKTVFGAADGQVSYFVGSVFDPQASIDYYVVLSGSLPTGLSMDESTGYLIGTLVLDDIYIAESFQFGVEGRSGDLVVDHAQFAFDVGLNLVAGDFTESVAYTITGSDGADHVTGGHGFSRRKTSTLTLGDGDNVVVLDGVSRHDDNRNTVVEITAGRGADTLTIGSHWARQSQSSMTIDLGDGDNSFTAGSQVAYEFGRLTFTSGTGDDVVIMGSEIGVRNGAKATLQTGAGNDKISVGDSAGGNNGGFELDSGDGDDVVLMGNMNSSNAGLSNLVLGAGADQLVVAANSGGANMTLSLDTGDASSADLVVFLGSININNGIDFGLGDVLAFSAGQMFDEFTDSNTATISGLTNAQVSLTFANTVTATWSEKDVTYQQLTNGDWIDVTANMTVVEFG